MLRATVTIATVYSIEPTSPVTPKIAGRDKQNSIIKTDRPKADTKPKTAVSISLNKAPAIKLTTNKIRTSTADNTGSTYRVRSATAAITTAQPKVTRVASDFFVTEPSHEKL